MYSLRIQRIANMIHAGMVLADIGTDHAFLPILAIKEKKVQKAYACDIAKGPLEVAKKNIQAEGLDNNITTILSNGLDAVPMDTDVVVIAGMGFFTARDILEKAGQQRLQHLKQIIVEVNRKPQLLRTWISMNHYTIIDEQIIHDRDFYYVAISFTTEYHQDYSDQQLLCGPILMHTQTQEYQDYCDHEISFIDAILSKYPRDDMHRKTLLVQKEYWQQAKTVDSAFN